MDLTLGAWGALAAIMAWVLGGAILDAVREWWWLRDQRRSMDAHRDSMARLRRR